ncbi:MAG: zinc ribbon domain-containing protein [Saprospiraceae bacterium]|nr:zinc ribbon domain-containing protein [Saprospiraceae bacterium]
MHCPNCGHSAQPGLARCGHCNYKLPETALPQAARDKGKIHCWNCTGENDSHADRCVQCNAKLQPPAAFKRPATARFSAAFTPNTSSHDE